MKNKFVFNVIDTEIRPKFAAAMIDWLELTKKTKSKLLNSIMGEALDDPDRWYYLAVIIPITDGFLEYDRAFIFLDDFAPMRGGYIENAIAEYINDPKAENAVSCHCCPCDSVIGKTKFTVIPVLKDNSI